MIAMPKNEIWVALQDSPNFLHLIFPKNYFTTNEIWSAFLEYDRPFMAFPKGETTTNWSKYFSICMSPLSSDETFEINDHFFRLNWNTMINIQTSVKSDGCFYKYMEYLNNEGQPHFEFAMYFNTKDHSGSIIVAYVEKLDKILSDEEFMEKLSHNDEMLPYEFEVVQY